MAVYAIGDIQGCYLTFRKLLTRIDFDPADDTLLLTGDLVNRGPHSLEVLRWVHRHRESVVTVVGNHDLKLLACAVSATPMKTRDTFQEVLEESRNQNVPTQEVARRIMQEAVVIVDRRERRVLRALLDENKGRRINAYRRSNYYRPAINSLLAEGHIRRLEDGRYVLTNTGMDAIKGFLMPILSEQGTNG